MGSLLLWGLLGLLAWVIYVLWQETDILGMRLSALAGSMHPLHYTNSGVVA